MRLEEWNRHSAPDLWGGHTCCSHYTHGSTIHNMAPVTAIPVPGAEVTPGPAPGPM